MISNYSSLIELFAALYVTMAVEFEFFRNIWNPKAKDAIDEILKNEEGTETTNSHFDLIKNSVDNLHESIAIITNRRGGFMLAMCVLLLIFIGNEKVESYLSLDICMILSWIAMLFSNYLLKKWKAVVGIVVIIFVCFLCINSSETLSSFLKKYSLVAFLIRNTSTFVVLTIILPIVHHLFVNWMYHGVYQGYLKNAMTVAIQEYNKAYKDKNDHPVENEDIDLSEIVDEFETRIRKICRPSIFSLGFSLLKHFYEVLIICPMETAKNHIEHFISKTKPNQPKVQGVRDYIKKKK